MKCYQLQCLLVKKYRERAGQLIGMIGSVAGLMIFIANPSFPTPDKIVVFLFFVFMIFRQATFVLKRLLPFVLILLVYDSFRGIADQLNTHVNYSWPPAADEWLFGSLPTATLQNWLWSGHVQWFDILLYVPYLLNFILPVGMVIVMWRAKQRYYWNYVTGFTLISFAAFFTFLVFPAAPPWLAVENGVIEPIERISSHVWMAMGLEDFPSIYNQISPNPVAAVPSLHTGWAVLLTIYIWRYFGRRWGVLTALYPLGVMFGTVYQGEHYVIDLLVGIIYAAAAYMAAPYVVSRGEKIYKRLKYRHEHAKRRMFKVLK